MRSPGGAGVLLLLAALCCCATPSLSASLRHQGGRRGPTLSSLLQLAGVGGEGTGSGSGSSAVVGGGAAGGGGGGGSNLIAQMLSQMENNVKEDLLVSKREHATRKSECAANSTQHVHAADLLRWTLRSLKPDAYFELNTTLLKSTLEANQVYQAATLQEVTHIDRRVAAIAADRPTHATPSAGLEAVDLEVVARALGVAQLLVLERVRSAVSASCCAGSIGSVATMKLLIGITREAT